MTKVQDTLLATYSQKCFLRSSSTKQNLVFWKNFQNKSDTQKHFQKQIKHSKIFLGLIIKQLSIYISHLNTYNHTNEIGIH